MHSFLRRFRILALASLSLVAVSALCLRKHAGNHSITGFGPAQPLLSIEELLPQSGALVPSKGWPGWSVPSMERDEQSFGRSVTLPPVSIICEFPSPPEIAYPFIAGDLIERGRDD
jgi:hypothetical protein